MSDIKLFENPFYTANKTKWRKHQDFFDGDDEILRRPEYLIPHELEVADHADATRIRRIRESRSFYEGNLELIVSRYTSLFFKDEPIPDEATKELFGDDWGDVTGQGKSFASFFREDVLQALLLQGRPIILTNGAPVRGQSKGDELAQKLRPTFKVLPALECKDWCFESQGERAGKFKFILWEYKALEERQSATEEPKTNLYAREFSYRGGTYIVTTWRQDKEVVGGQEQINWVPVSKDEFPGYPDLPIKSIEGESWVKDSARLCQKLFNLQSTRDNIHLYQAHQRTYITGVTNEDQKKALAEYTIGFLPENGGVITVEPVNTASIDLNIERTQQAIFKSAFNQTKSGSSDSKMIEAADSQQEGKEQLVTLIVSEIESLENLANAAIKDYAWFKNSDPNFQGKVTFNRDVKIEDIDREIRIYSALRDDISRVPTWRKEVLKKFATKQDLGQIDKILDEIEASTGAEDRTDVRQTLLGAIGGRAEP